MRNKLHLFYLCIIIIMGVMITHHGYAKTQKGLYARVAPAVSYSPAGMQINWNLFFRFPLSDSTNILWENTKLDIGLQNTFTPTDNLLALFFNIEPIAFFDFTFVAGYHLMFTAFGYGFQAVSSPSDDYSPDALKEIPKQNKSGYWMTFTPTLKFKLQNFIAANSLAFNYFYKSDYSGYYYEPHTDTILRESDWNFTNDIYGFYQVNSKIMAGLNYTYIKTPSTDYVSQRLGGIFVFTPAISRFYDFQAVVVAGTYLKNHFFTGKLFFQVQASMVFKIHP
jgi:hypothetical protein